MGKLTTSLLSNIGKRPDALPQENSEVDVVRPTELSDLSPAQLQWHPEVNQLLGC